jgi:hypothetical protein
MMRKLKKRVEICCNDRNLCVLIHEIVIVMMNEGDRIVLDELFFSPTTYSSINTFAPVMLGKNTPQYVSFRIYSLTYDRR